MSFVATPEVQAEWFDTPAVPVESLLVALPEPNEDYAYAAARLLSWFPVVNQKGATYFKDDFDYDLLDTLKGKQANLEHDKTRIVGTICDFLVTDEGIDIAVQIDRTCAKLQGLSLDSLRSGNYFSHVSVELTRSLNDSYFYGIDDGYNVVQKIPVKTGLTMGMRRTTEGDPYKLQGNRVIERIKPARFTGVGFVPDPADVTADLYAVAASTSSEDKKLTPESASSDPLPQEFTNMTEAEYQGQIATLNATIATLTAETASAATVKSEFETAKTELASANTELASVKTELETAKTELASVTTERDALKDAAAKRETASKLDAFLDECHTILAFENDEERNTAREEASAFIDDEGKKAAVKTARELAAAKAKIAELEEKAAAPKTEEKPAGETASETASKGGFVAETPKVAIGPKFQSPSGKSYSTEDLVAAF